MQITISLKVKVLRKDIFNYSKTWQAYIKSWKVKQIKADAA